MVHGAVVVLGEEGILIPSFGNTGKTTTSWMLAIRGARFVTDEFAILDSEGMCFGFPCSSLVTSRLVRASGIQLTNRQSVSLHLNGIRSKLLSSRFAPGGVKLYPDKFFRTSERVAITRIVFIQNGFDDLRQVKSEEAVKLLRSIQEYEMNWRANPFVIARSFFQPTFDPQTISAKEERTLKTLASRVRGSYLVSSLNERHYRAIEEISRIFKAIEQPPTQIISQKA